MEEALDADNFDSAHSCLLTKYSGLLYIDLNPSKWKFKIDNEMMCNDVGDE